MSELGLIYDPETVSLALSGRGDEELEGLDGFKVCRVGREIVGVRQGEHAPSLALVYQSADHARRALHFLQHGEPG